MYASAAMCDLVRPSSSFARANDTATNSDISNQSRPYSSRGSLSRQRNDSTNKPSDVVAAKLRTTDMSDLAPVNLHFEDSGEWYSLPEWAEYFISIGKQLAS